MKNWYSSIQYDLNQVDLVIKEQLLKLSCEEVFVDKAFSAFFGTPGKKLRPALTLLSAFAVRQDNMGSVRESDQYRSILSLATITELVHSVSLMHDDVLDDDVVRRGKLSMNAQFGNKIAILAGDILYSHAFEMLVTTADKAVVVALLQCVQKMCSGEITNLRHHGFDNYQTIVENKTASLMEFCCWSGAFSVGRDTNMDMVHSLKKFGYCFGMLFQILDDFDDGDSETLMESRDAVFVLVDKFKDEAQLAMSSIPDSVYKADLLEMFQRVILDLDAVRVNEEASESSVL